MRKLALGLALCLALAGCTGPDARLPHGLRPIANPSAIVATELAFAREAQEKGQWTAFEKYAADDAVMFVPQAVTAKDWLKKQANPAQAVAWQPYAVWMSCDGSLAVSKGAWQRPNGTNGYFTTVWRRQKDGSYKWILDQGDALAKPAPAPEMISGQVADCGPAATSASAAADFTANLAASGISGAPFTVRTSDDRTLVYAYAVEDGGARKFRVGLFQNGKVQPVLSSDVAAK